MSPSLSTLNCFPCTGFVRIFANIFSVPKCVMTASLLVTLSANQKYLMSMCLDLSDPGASLFIKAMQLLLFWYIVAGPMSYPCALRKFRVCMAWLAVSDNGWRLCHNFYLEDFAYNGPPSPSTMAHPVCDLPLSCAYATMVHFLPQIQDRANGCYRSCSGWKLEASTAGIASAAVGRAALARRFLICSFAFHRMQVQLLIMSEYTL